MTGSDFSEITKKSPEKSLTYSLKEKIPAVTTRVKSQLDIVAAVLRRKYRLIDFKRNKDGIPAKVVANRVRSKQNSKHCFNLLRRWTEVLHYCTNKLEVGTTIMNGPDAEIHVGNCHST